MPRVEEACPHGLAPTTSTLVQLALGDALAIALLERRGFSAADFRKFHPGGSLGATLAHVRDVMHSGDRLPLAPLGTEMREALILISQKRFGCLGIVDGAGDLVGIITDGDLRRHLSGNILDRRVEDVMTRDPKTIAPDALVASALEILNSAVDHGADGGRAPQAGRHRAHARPPPDRRGLRRLRRFPRSAPIRRPR